MNGTGFLTVLAIATGLSMDAFAVAVTQGACLDIRTLRYPLSIGITFGFFQALMPLLGWLAGSSFSSMIQHLDHWIALVLLAIIGVKMFIDGYIDYRRKRSAKENGLACEVSCGGELRFHDLMMMGIATSIDALAVGITFGMLRIDIWSSILVIGLTTFLFSTSGVYLGKRAGPLLGDRMEMIGGSVLLLLGLKIFTEHIIKGI